MTNQRAISADPRLAQLEDSENKIRTAFRRGLDATCSIAKELHKIYSQDLYTVKTEDFTEYITDYLNINIVTYRRIVAISQTVAQLQDAGLALPANESLAAELSRLDPDLRPKIWNSLVIQAETEEKALTTEDIRRAVDMVQRQAPRTLKAAAPAGIEVEMDQENGSEPPAKPSKPQAQEGQLVLTEKGEAALSRIKKICGAQIAKAIEDGTIAMTERDIRNWAEYDDAMMRTLVYYIVQRWTLSKAVAFESREIQESTDIRDLITIASARGGSARVNFGKAKISVDLET